MSDTLRGTTYDAYWQSRDEDRTRPRSRERAEAALGLLRRAGCGGGRLLEIGCGPGWALEVFRAAGFDARGADCSPFALDAARSRGLQVSEVDVEEVSAEALTASAGGTPGVVVALEVLEHVASPLEVLRKLAVMVAPKGYVVVSLPNEIHVAARLAVAAGRLPFGGHDDPHVRHFDRRRARGLLDAAGLRILGSRPQSIVPPRHRILRALIAPLVGLAPGLFSLSEVFLLEGSRA